MKVRELVQIEEVEEVVQITRHDPEKIVETFVADERLEERICFLLDRFLNRREKNSFLIIGGYGSGKSHLLSFLGDLFDHPHLWEKVKSEKIRSFAPKFREKKFIPIWIHLPSTKVDLQDQIWLELEKQLSERLGETVTLAPGKYLEKAEEDPRFEDFLRKNLDREMPKEAWESRKSRHPQSALELARSFFNQLGLRPQIEETVEEVMERALGRLTDKFGEDTYLVLIIDELYDFLRGKDSPGFARDIAFLRDLGEAGRAYKFFVLASLQEDILDPERAGAERDNLNRIRQRYEVLSIPYLNLQKVARERVLKKNKQQVEELRQLYSLLRREYFPSLAIAEHSFVDLYPAHPAILPLYEKVVREVGPRSILSFLSHSALEVQDQPHDSLVTIAELYDYLKSDLITHATYGELVRDVFPYFEERIPLRLEKEQEWALKAIKALIILYIAGERRNCKELAELILYRGMEGNLNYQFFAQLMKKLHGEAGAYLYHGEGSGIDAVYTLQLGGPNIEVLINNEIAKIRDDDPGLWQELLEGFKGSKGMEAPKELEVDKWCGLRVDWRNTERKGVARFLVRADPNAPQEAMDKMRDADLDFLLLILRPNLPSDYLPQKELQDERILIWRPEEMDKEKVEILKKRLAIRRLLEEGLEEQVKEKLRSMEQKASDEVEEMVRQIYQNGTLTYLSSPLPSPFFKAVEESVKKLLEGIYPEHPSFPRKISRRMLREAIRFLSGLVSPDSTQSDYADALAAAGLLVKEGEESYLVREEAEPYRRIMEILRSREYVSVQEIYESLRGKPYGLREEVVEFLILALVSKGLASIKGAEGEFYHFNMGELIGKDLMGDNYYLHRLEIIISQEVMEFLRELFKDVKLDTTEKRANLWEKDLRKLPSEYPLEKLEEKITAFHSPFNVDALEERWREVREGVEKLFRIINETPSPQEGFAKLGELIGENYREFIRVWREFQTLKDIIDSQEELNGEIDYLQRISLPPENRLLERGRKLLRELEGKDVARKEFLKSWQEQVKEFKEEYIENYTAIHERSVGNSAPWWEKLEELRGEAKLKALKELWGIIGEGVFNPAERIRREIEDLLRKRCSQLYKDSLRIHPLCVCGFDPANPPNIGRHKERLERELEREWGEVIAQLRNEEERIKKELEKATSRAREEIEGLLRGEPIPPSEETKEILRRALGRLNIIDVDLSPFIKDGGIYRIEDFLGRIQEALRGVGRGENVRIRIKIR